MIRHTQIINTLMIFSLLCFVFSVDDVFAQDNNRQAEAFEQQVLNNLNYGNQYNLSNESNSLTLPEKARGADQLSERNKRVSSRPNQNYIQLQINGDQNHFSAEQIQGRNNYMDLEIDGNANQGKYLQQGNSNFIHDRISGEGVTHEIQQLGNGLGIYNQGMSTLPMKIHQQGKGMQLLIK
ncbi:MAG: hypothetical protein KGY60_09295 [Bacteroidales bacterium]|nr:hypothetical protein [Bacteroidales bacterium]